MIYYIRRYWKYALIFLVCLISFISIYLYNDSNNVNTNSAKKLSVTKKENQEDTKTLKTVFVDVKGAVNAPGVYELEENKRIIDAINLAGGLSSNANTININLSKKLEDEMYIVVYTKNEIAEYKKSHGEEKIVCASNECVCPDDKNDACISNNTNSSSKKDSTINDNVAINTKISINTASKEDLMTLNGIGEAKANAIIEYRTQNGNFKKIEDIKNVSGIGDAIYEKIKNNITL